jgi:hypothetical protein
MHVTEFSLFPTRLLTIQFADVDGLNEELYRLFSSRDEFRDDFNMHPDTLNLLRLADSYPGIARLRGMFLGGLSRYLRGEHVHGELSADMVLFSNYARKGDFTLVHNHNADVVGIYTPSGAE